MATIDQTGQTTPAVHQSSLGGRGIYAAEIWVKATDVVATKGSILAQADVIQIFDLPAETKVLCGTLEIETADTGTTLTGDLGYGSGIDVLVDGADLTTAAIAAAGTNGAIGFENAFQVTSADTIDLKLITLSSAGDDWVVRVLLMLQDISGQGQPSPAQALNS